MPRFWLAAGAVNMLLALVIAAGTGHQPPGEFVPLAKNTLDTAREMHFVHALALIATGILGAQFGRSRLIDAAGWAFLAGIALFCGGIYAANIFGLAQFKFTVPFGGASLMAGWILFAVGALRPNRKL
jgi:uncharacterized membrane protein YgdD (TMEM256/DUF423 family)